MTTGPQAETYADHFIAVHLQEIGGGLTYAQFPPTGLTPQQTAQKAALFQGETLRGLLLNAYGWWQIGQYAQYAAIGLSIAAFAVLLAFAFELAVWRRSTAGTPAADRATVAARMTRVA